MNREVDRRREEDRLKFVDDLLATLPIERSMLILQE